MHGISESPKLDCKVLVPVMPNNEEMEFIKF